MKPPYVIVGKDRAMAFRANVDFIPNADGEDTRFSLRRIGELHGSEVYQDDAAPDDFYMTGDGK